MAHPIFVLLRVNRAGALQLLARRDGWDGGGVHDDAATNSFHEHHT